MSFLRILFKAVIGLACAAPFIATTAGAQVKVGDNASSMNPDAVFEMESSNKGMLIPRLNLSATNVAAPLSGFTAGMVVFNEASAGSGIHAVTPGVYYSDGTKWIKTTAGGGSGTLQSNTVVTNNGQTDFTTPSAITDPSKILLYRNGIAIGFTVANPTTITAEIATVAGDEIRIVQHN